MTLRTKSSRFSFLSFLQRGRKRRQEIDRQQRHVRVLELLEDRTLLAAAMGTTGDDDITIRANAIDPTIIELDIDGTVSTFNSTDLLEIDALDGFDTFTVDFLNGNPIPAGGLSLTGNGDDDSLFLIDPLGTAFTDIDYTLGEGLAGEILIDGSVIQHDLVEFEDIVDELSADNRSFNLLGDDDVFFIGDDGNPGDGVNAFEPSFAIAQPLPVITFNAPTTSLAVNSGDGFDEIEVGLVDGIPQISFDAQGDAGQLYFGDEFATDVDYDLTTDSVVIDGGLQIDHANFDVIIDELDAANRSFSFGATDDAINLLTFGPEADALGLFNSDIFFELTSGTTPIEFRSDGTTTVNAGDGDDVLTVDFDGQDIGLLPNADFVFDGGGQAAGDSIVLDNGLPTQVTHVFTNDNDGSIDVDAFNVTYTGLEPIQDNLDATNRVFTFLNSVTDGELSQSPLDPSLTRIDSSQNEMVDFVAATGSMQIVLAGGDDNFVVNSLAAGYATPANSISAGAGNDVVTFNDPTVDWTVGGNADDDDLIINLTSVNNTSVTAALSGITSTDGTFNSTLDDAGFEQVFITTAGGEDGFLVSPRFGTEFIIDGGAPNTLPGDQLFYDGPGLDTVLDAATGTGVISSPNAADVRYTNIEQVHVASPVADWLPAGAAPTTGGQVTGIANRPVVGAIHTVVAHPSNPNVVYIGAVNGGIWRTRNAQAAEPFWEPLTDFEESLSIGALEFHPDDPNTLIAGIARNSSFGGSGGPQTGLLLTNDGGDTWTSNTELEDLNINGLAIRGTGATATITAATSNGIRRSTDGGNTFTLSFPGNIRDLDTDPNDLNRLYATAVGFGVLRSDDGGATWTNISGADPALNAVMTDGRNNHAELSVSPVDGRLFLIAVLNGQANYIGYYVPGTNAWHAMDLPLLPSSGGAVDGIHPREKPGGQGALHLSIAADPVDADKVYVGGDRQNDASPTSPNYIGATNFTAALFRGDASQPATGQVPSPQWSHITDRNNIVDIPEGGTANSTAPHADSREIVFDAAGNLIEANDGGLYLRTNPRDNTGDWFSIMGASLQVHEFHDIAYDTNSNIIIAGTQDTGTVEQLADGSLTYRTVNQGDGGDVPVDVITLAASGQSIRYNSSQNLGGFSRRVIDADNNVVSNTAVTLTGGGALVPRFKTPVFLNEFVPSRMIIGAGNAIYESLNMGDNVLIVGDGSVVNTDALVYGGRRGSVVNQELIYAGVGASVMIREAIPDIVTITQLTPTNYAGGNVRDIITSPLDWHVVFAADADEVFMSDDKGDTWTNVTGNLGALAASDFRALEYVATPFVEGVILGTVHGVFFATNQSGYTEWEILGSGLPNTQVYELDYDPADDVLVAGTLGRGAWIFDNVTERVANTDPIVLANLDNNNIIVRRGPTSPTEVEVEVDGVIVQRYSYLGLNTLTINGVTGDDQLTVDYSFGNPIPDGGLFYEGDQHSVTGDSLLITGGNVDTITHNMIDTTSGNIDIDGSVVHYAELELQPVRDTMQVRNRIFNFNDTSDLVTIEDVGTTTDSRTLISTVSTSMAVDFFNPTRTLTVNGNGGSEDIRILKFEETGFDGFGPLLADATFGTAGTIRQAGDIYDLIAMDDGRMLAVGTTPGETQVQLTRYNLDGSLDTTFGVGGVVATQFTSERDIATTVAIQPDGKIVIGGVGYDGPEFDFLLARYNDNGSLDATFGTGGLVVIDMSTGEFNEIHNLLVQPDGSILVGGNIDVIANPASPNADFALVRYTPTGALDATFGTNGQITTDLSGGNDRAFGMALQLDGKILLGGVANDGTAASSLAIARYETTGALDTTFGLGGISITDVAGSDFDIGYDLVIQVETPIGGPVVEKPILVGRTGSDPDSNIVVARYNADGTLDASFDGGGTSTQLGVVTTDLGGNDIAFTVAMQPDNHILVAGRGDSSNAAALVRYREDGSLESNTLVAFDDDQAQVIDFVNPTGEILIAGNDFNTDGGFISRFTGSPILSDLALIINGNDGDDTVILDFSNGNPIPIGGLSYEGGSQTSIGDDLILRNGTVTNVTHNFIDANSGSVDVDARIANYSGLEPILDVLIATDRVFNFLPGMDDEIRLTDDPIVNNGLNLITSVSSSESVRFLNPTTTLTINSLAGNDFIEVDSFDEMIPVSTSAVAPVSLMRDEFPTTTFDNRFWAQVGNATIDDVGLNVPSPLFAARLNARPTGSDELRSRLFDLSQTIEVTLNYEMQRTGGGNAPDQDGEDLIVEYLNSQGQWIEIVRHEHDDPAISDTDFMAFTVSMPFDALHPDFQFRFRSFGDANATTNLDDWFIDDVELLTSDGNIVVSAGAIQMTIDAGTGEDTIDVVPGRTTTIHVDGLDPIVAPGDTLIYSGDAVHTPSAVTPRSGTISLAGFQDVTYTDIEDVVIDRGTASIGNRIWHDLDGNGLQFTAGVGEPGVHGAVAELLIAGPDGIENTFDDISLGTAVSDSSGFYEFTNVFHEDYYIAFRPPVGFDYTAQNVGGDDTIDSDADNTTGHTQTITILTGDINNDVDLGLIGAAPEFGWAAEAGGTSNEHGDAIVVDDDGNSYVTGHFTGTADFDHGPGTITLSSAGNEDIFVAKYTVTGALVWARRIGGAGIDVGTGIALETTGMSNTVIITGSFEETVDFDPIRSGVANATSSGGKDVFLLRLDSDGNHVWDQQFGGTADDLSEDITVDVNGNIYTTGQFFGSVDFGGTTLTAAATGSAYATKFDASGNLAWATSSGGGTAISGQGIAVDSVGDVRVTGWFEGTASFTPAASITSNGQSDIFVWTILPTGVSQNAQGFGAAGDDRGEAIAINGRDEVVITGSFNGTVDFGAGFNLTSAGLTDIFVSVFDSIGNTEQAVGIGGIDEDAGLGITTGFEDRIYVTGLFNDDVDFDPGAGVRTLSAGGGSKAFILQLNADGTLGFAEQQQGGGVAAGYGIALDPSDNAYVTGDFEGNVDFDPFTTTFNTNWAGGTDVFVWRLTTTGSITGRKFHDVDGNQLRTIGEDYLDGWVIELVDSNGIVVATTTTTSIDSGNDGIDPDTEVGLYEFLDVIPGNYTVREVLQPNWGASLPITAEYSVTVIARESVIDRDFGNYVQSSITGRKFNDRSGNGTSDPAEPWLNGWTVELVNAAGTVIASSVTSDVDLDGSGTIDPLTEVGVYQFTNVAPGTYTIREVNQAGWRIVSPTTGEYSRTLTSGTNIVDLDFANLVPIEIYGGKWEDVNADGVRDASEPWLDGWTIELLDGAGAVVATTVTAPLDLDGNGTFEPDEFGQYQFLGLDPGDYEVREVIPSLAWGQSAPATGTYALPGLLGDDVVVAQDFGNYLFVTISGHKWDDRNNDDLQGVGEDSLNGWTFELVDINGVVIDTQVTADLDLDGSGIIDPINERGAYQFVNVIPGTYTVREVLQPGWRISTPLNGEHTLTVISGDVITDRNIGNYVPIEIYGAKFHDLNADSIRDAGEPGLNGWTIELLDSTGTVVQTTVTADIDLNGDLTIQANEVGRYQFLGVDPGDYTVREVLQTDWLQSAPTTGVFDLPGTLGSEVYTDQDFGNFQFATFAGRKLNDRSGNGTFDPAEPFVNGWTVELVNAAGAVVATTMTTDFDSDGDGTTEPGWYIFDMVIPNNAANPSYTIREVNQPGWRIVNPTTGEYTRSVISNQEVLDLDFANLVPIEIYGGKWEDLNADAVRNVGEPWLDGWTIELLDGAGAVIATTVTGPLDLNGNGTIEPDEQGQYQFLGLDPGDYEVREVIPSLDWGQSAPIGGTYPLPGLLGDDVIVAQDFGNFLFVEISGHKWDDRNNDDLQGPGENSLNGWTFELVDINGVVIDTQVSAERDINGDTIIDPITETGAYHFVNVIPGTYTVREVLQPGWRISTPVNGEHTLTVISGDVISDLNVANYEPIEIFGAKFHDLNADGVRDAGDVGLNGWTIELVDGTGAVVQTTVTDNIDLNGDLAIQANEVGRYQFLGVDPGDYSIREVLQTDWLQSAPTTGVFDLPGTLGSEVYTDQDFGNFQFATIAGRKWNDLDGHGVLDASEVFLNGWTIELVDSTGAVVATTMTTDFDSDGDGTTEPGWYVFDMVIPTNAANPTYTIQETLNGWIQSFPTEITGSAVHTVTAFSNQLIDDQDFGNFDPSSITGQKYEDVNGNGQWDTAEPFLDGWTIQLVDVANPATPFLTTTTGPDGRYTFSNLPSRNFEIVEIQQAGWRHSQPAGDRHALTVDPDTDYGVGVRDFDFGNYRSGIINGRKWDDQNANNLREANEQWLDGWRITITDANGNSTSTLTSSIDLNGDTVIDDSEIGWYSFENLRPGDWRITEEIRENWLQSTPLFVTGLSHYDVALTSNSTVTENFGNFLPSNIEGRKYEDLNADGFRQSGEPFLNGAIIELYNGAGALISSTQTADRDLNGDGFIDPLTDMGWYSFIELATGDYEIGEDLAAFSTLTGETWFKSEPAADRHLITTTTGSSWVRDFGNYRQGQLAGRKFNDLDGDTIRSANEPWLNGWEIVLADENGTELQRVQTADWDRNGNSTIEPDETGWYFFDNLDPAFYTIVEVNQTGWRQTTPFPPDHTVNLESGVTFEDLDFGNFQLASASGRKFHDRNADGIRDAGEEYLNGWQITLVDPTGVIVGTSVTSDVDFNDDGIIDPETERGWYIFDNVEPDLAGNDFSIQETLVGAWQKSTPVGAGHLSPLVSGSAPTNLDFGNFLFATINGRKFEDVNSNGVRDAGEGYLNDWQFDLLDDTGTLLTTVTTADNDLDNNGVIDPETEAGWWIFNNLVPGTYTVSEPAVAGWSQTTPAGTITVTVASDEVSTGHTFGNYELATLSGRKFHDINGNQTQDAGEEYLNGWTFELMDSTGTVIATTMTTDFDSDGDGTTEPGWYVFDGLFSDTYTITETLRAGWGQSTPTAAGYTVPVVSGDVETTLDFGNFQFSTISGRNAVDTNANGLIETGEPFLNGWTIELVDTAGNVVDTVVTADDDRDGNGTIDTPDDIGWYTFTNVVPGDYTVREVLQTDWAVSLPTSGEYAVTVISGDTQTGFDFANFQSVTISGGKFHDLNANGTREAAEPWLEGWMFDAFDVNGDLVTTVTTGADGQYVFNDLLPGTYTIREQQQTDWILSTPVSGEFTTTLGSGELVSGFDFGNYQFVEISGRKFNDLDGDGIRTANEPWLQGWVIQLDDGTGTIVESTTDVDGQYSFVDLVPGSYTVNEVQQTGWTQSLPATSTYDLTLQSMDVAADRDFGNFQPGSISGRKYEDLNANGQRDAGEQYLNGWTIQLLDNQGTVISSTVTADFDSDGDGTLEAGWYSFTGLAQFDATIHEVNQTGWIQSQPLIGDYSLTIQPTLDLTADFGNYQNAEIVGRKWHDLNGNGQLDGNEPFLNGWTIELINSQGQVASSTTTAGIDADGNGTIEASEDGWYSFTDLKPGTWLVREVIPADWVGTSPNGGSIAQQAFDLDQSLNLKFTGNFHEDAHGLNEKWLLTEDTEEWYFITPGGLFVKWDNVPGSGTGEIVAQLAPRFHADPALLYAPTEPNQLSETLISNQSVTLSFGNYQFATVTGRKFEDLDRNGSRDANEPYLNNWEIQLVDSAGNPIQTTTTMDVDLNGDGSIDPETEQGWYSFENVAPGDYSVREVLQTGWIRTTPTSTGPAEDAFALDHRFDFRFDGTLYENAYGTGERWILGTVPDNQWYYILPNGELHEWDETPATTSGRLVGTFPTTYFADPSLLYNAVDPTGLSITVVAGTDNTGFDFGNAIQPGEITGRKFHDIDGSGIQNGTEPYLNGWTIELLDSNGVVVATTTTMDRDLNDDGNITPERETGWYEFTNLDGSEFTVREVPQAGWVSPEPIDVSLATVRDFRVADLANYQPASVSGQKFHDLDGNSTQDASEPFLNGWTIELVDSLGTVVATTVTADLDLDGDGNIEVGAYQFTGLKPGDYSVREISQAGWQQSAPNLDALSARAAELDRQLNLISTNAAFQNWGGLNERWLNGAAQVSGETSLTWYYITPNGDLFLWDGVSGRTSGTGLNGTYIDTLSPTYYGTPELLTDPVSPNFFAGSGTETTDLNFGNYQPATVSGRVFQDTDQSGTRDAGEQYINGWQIELLDANGQLVTTTRSADLDRNGDGQIDPETERGWYTFAGLRAGTYSVQQVFISNFEQSTPGFGPEAESVYQIDQQLGLFATENQFQNFGHLNEKWLLGQSFDANDQNGQWYYLTPNGNLYEWDEASGGTQGEVSGTLIASIPEFYYRNLDSLHTALDPRIDLASGDTIDDLDFGDFSPLDDVFSPGAIGGLLDQ